MFLLAACGKDAADPILAEDMVRKRESPEWQTAEVVGGWEHVGESVTVLRGKEKTPRTGKKRLAEPHV